MGRMVANMVALLCVAKALAAMCVFTKATCAVAGSHGRRPDLRYMLPLPGEAAVRYRQGTRGRPPPGPFKASATS